MGFLAREWLDPSNDIYDTHDFCTCCKEWKPKSEFNYFVSILFCSKCLEGC